MNGSYNPDTRTISINPTLSEADQLGVMLHEVQHPVQDAEGFGSGANPRDQAVVERANRVIDQKLADTRQRINEIEGQMRAWWQQQHPGEPLTGKGMDQFWAQNSGLKKERDAGYDLITNPRPARQEENKLQYRRASGEVEAKNVQDRKDMDAGQRRVVPPWETQKVPYDQQWLMPPYRGPRMLDQIAPSNDALRLWTEPAQAAASPESVMRIRSRRRPS